MINVPPPTPRQTRLFWNALAGVSIAAMLLLVGVVLWGFGKILNLLTPVLLPLALAGILAYLLDPIVDFLERRRVKRVRAILLVFLAILVLFLGLLATVVPRLVVEAGALVDNTPHYISAAQGRVEKWLNTSPWRHRIDFLLPGSFQEFLGRTNSPGVIATTNVNAAAVGTNGIPAAPTATTNTNTVTTAAQPAQVNSSPTPTPQETGSLLMQWAAKLLPRIWQWIVEQLSKAASLVGLILGLLLVPVFLFYFLLDKKGIQENWQKYLPVRDSKFKEELIFVLTSINDCLIVFFRGQVLVALCTGTLLTVGFLLLGLNYALLLGVLAGLLGIIPYLGVMISLLPAAGLAAMQFGTWYHPLIVVGIFAVVNMLEGLVISPKIIGDRVGLHPLTVIISVMIGTTLMGGILGGVLAIPLTAALRALMFRYVWVNRTPPASPMET